jgi:SsrA-binding protein
MIKNKKAYFNYEILETLEAGIVLKGHEVKAVKDKRVNIENAHIRVMNDELWLINADIQRYKYYDDDDYDSTRSRKLLVKRREINWLLSKSKQGRLTIIPLKIYVTRNKIKLMIGLAKGKKKHEKKNVQKERDLDRELHREKRKYMVQ